MRRKRTTYYYFVGVLLLFFKPPAVSQQVVLRTDDVIYHFDEQLLLAVDAFSTTSFSELSDANLQFIPLKEWKRFDVGKVYWAKIQLINNLPTKNSNFEWVLKFPLVTTDIEIFAKDDAGNLQTGSSGFFKPIRERTFVPVTKGNFIQLNLLPNKNYELYFRLQFDRPDDPPEFGVELFSLEKFWSDINRTNQRNAIYLGLVLMMLIYNLILFFFAKDRAFLFYSIYLLGVTIYTVYNSGDLANWITESLFPNQPQYIFYFKLSIYITLTAYLTFVRIFMDLSELLPTWDKIYKWLSIIAIPWIIADAYLMWSTNFSYTTADRLLILFAVLVILSLFSIIIPLLKLKDPKAYFIIFGISSMGLGILLTIWARLQTVEFSIFYFKIFSVLEIIAFSLGLAYRRLLSEREKQQTRFELEKSKLIQEQEQKEAERLKEIDSLKSRLYTNITHEFRTPLTVIMGMSEEIEGHEKAKKLIQRNSKNLLQLINQMLDLAKAEEGKLKLNLTQNDIITYLRYITESFLSAAETKNIRLTFYTETESCIMFYDEDKILYIVQNLLSNAIKFTPAYGTIVFHAKTIHFQNQTYLQLKVKDSGIGISSTDIPHIFDRFYQTDNTSTRKVGGTGIGLALVKELIQLMDGEIEVNSELGKGSEFKVQLPILEQDLSAQDRTNIDQKSEIQISKTDPKVYAILTNGEHTEKIGLSATKKSKETTDELPILLIIEDNPDVRTYLYSCLKAFYNIEVAKNGKEGIDKAYEIIPDIIISDVMMPEKDGFEVTQTLKKDSRTSHIPIILLTAKATQKNKLTGLKYGADAYLMKPFDKEELIIRLEQLVVLRKQLQVNFTKRRYTTQKIFQEKNGKDIAFINELSGIVQSNLADSDFSVPQIASAMKMSQVQVYRKLKALTGKTPSQYIRFLRMEKAMDLLKNTNLNISEIAYDLGFSDPNYFSRTFQQVYGQTPSSIRKK